MRVRVRVSEGAVRTRHGRCAHIVCTRHGQCAHDLHEGARAHAHARGAPVPAAREPKRQRHVGRVAVGPALQAHRLETQRVHRVRPVVVGGAHAEHARDRLCGRAVEQAKDGTVDVAADLGVLALEPGDTHCVPQPTRTTHARVGAQKLVVVVPLAAPVQAAVCGVRPEMTAVIAAVRPGSAVPPGRRIQAARGQAERLEAGRDCPLDGHRPRGELRRQQNARVKKKEEKLLSRSRA